jgi:pimeloyl-ACP methyl ester carboxylesterase
MELLSRDGVRLAYRDQGTGNPPMLFVHGWCCDHTYFAPQIEHFGQRHRVVAVDLRGHGKSDKPEQAYSIAGFADDLAWVIGQLELEPPVIVGHSMGGVIAFDMAARYPECVGAVVGVDAPIVPEISMSDLAAGLLEGLKSPAYQDVVRGFVNQGMFLPTDDAERSAQITDHMAQAPQHVMISALEETLIKYDAETSAARCTSPALLITSAPQSVDVNRLRELCPHVEFGQTFGSGHFNQLEVPEQVNAMIERFIEISPVVAQ